MMQLGKKQMPPRAREDPVEQHSERDLVGRVEKQLK